MPDTGLSSLCTASKRWRRTALAAAPTEDVGTPDAGDDGGGADGGDEDGDGDDASLG